MDTQKQTPRKTSRLTQGVGGIFPKVSKMATNKSVLKHLSTALIFIRINSPGDDSFAFVHQGVPKQLHLCVACWFFFFSSFFCLQIWSTLTDNNNGYSQLHSLFFCFLQELMQNSQCVLSKWKNKYVCQVKWFDMLLQCLTNGAENYAVIGILVLW